MTTFDIITLSALILFAAMLYSAVGHAGASAYIAAMALYGLAPTVMKPTALVLNILVATLTTYRMHRAELTNVKATLPFVFGSVPLAYIGGAIQLPGQWYRLLIGGMLLFAAYRLLRTSSLPLAQQEQQHARVTTVPVVPACLIGAGIGLLSGLTGTGGGIFLSPLIVLLGWAGMRQSSGIAAPFILVNSIAGLAGNFASTRALPSELPYFVVAALVGALLGTRLGIQWLPTHWLQRLLAFVLLVAALKFILV